LRWHFGRTTPQPLPKPHGQKGEFGGVDRPNVNHLFSPEQYPNEKNQIMAMDGFGGALCFSLTLVWWWL
jgi:hypothetical protein